MQELFTVEEINLMCIFNTDSRNRLIFELVEAMANFEDDELLEIAQNAINKVSKLSDADFDALDFYPIYDDETEADA